LNALLWFFLKFLFSNSSSRQCLPPPSVFSSYWQERSRQKMMRCICGSSTILFIWRDLTHGEKMKKEINLWKLCREWWNRPRPGLDWKKFQPDE
jgi:hypothetical protein